MENERRKLRKVNKGNVIRTRKINKNEKEYKPTRERPYLEAFSIQKISSIILLEN